MASINTQHDSLDWTEGVESIPVYSYDKNMIKSYKSATYVKCNIPGPGCDTEDFQEQLLGCDCLSETCDNDCSCKTRYGKHYENKLLSKPYLYLNSHVSPVFECNSQCKCTSKCSNRVVQHSIRVQLQVFMTEDKGLGLRSLEHISVGQFVCEYAGEILCLGEAKRRTLLQTETDMNYILTVREHHKNGVITTHVDPSLKGNIGRYINHSCTPNLVMVPVRVNNMIPKICLFALHGIQPCEELSFIYGSNISNSENDANQSLHGMSKSNQSLHGNAKSQKPCYCKTEKCKGYMPFDETLFR